MHLLLVRKITAHSIILTPNKRLARLLQQQLEQQQTQITWRTIPILPLQTWLKNCYQNTLLQQQRPLSLLNENQEFCLWQQIITASKAGATLLQPAATAQTAQQAYQTLCAWNLPLDTLVEDQHYHDNNPFFLSWAKTFKRYCQKHQLLSQAQLSDYLTSGSVNNASKLPQQLLLFNFDELTPQIEQLLTRLAAQGVKIDTIEEKCTNQSQQQVVCNDINDELLTMARWAKACLQQHPDSRITCVVPNLTAIRNEVVQVFTAVFSPAALFNPDLMQKTFNISGGYALSHAPIINQALKLLGSNPFSISIDDLTQWLTSPFVAGFTEEANQRACFDVKLRTYNEPVFSWKTLLYLLPKSDCSLFAQQIMAWLNDYKNLPKKQSLSAWSQCFHQLLQQLGWAQGRRLNSSEYQQTTRFDQLLHELPTLSLEPKQYTYAQALQLLQQLTQRTLFATQSHDGPVQVLGLLEAAGHVSDYLWIMHVDDETLPAAANPNPFLPYHLQQKYNMPHSSASRELEFAEKLWQRFTHSAQHIIFSHHQYDGERGLSASAMLNHIPHVTQESLNLSTYQPLTASIYSPTNYEYLIDDKGPAIGIKQKIAGGTGIFKQQAACPFRAFAQYRLHAYGLPIPENGLNARERGSLLHLCLDKLWARLKTQQHLLQQTPAELDTMVATSIEAAFSEFFPAHSHKFKTKFKFLEQQRLQQLLLTWLDLEKQRPMFSVINHEQRRQIKIGNVTVTVQIDRIDQLASGKKIVIDYKSGRVKVSDWFGLRPREPQLPLYLLSEPNIDGIAVAQVCIDAIKLKGITANETNIDGLETLERYKNYTTANTWEELIAQWQQVLQQLAIAFTHGQADVNPAYYDTCNNCRLFSLCRINEKLRR